MIPLAAFTLGLLLKDVLTKGMEDYVSGSTGYYTSPSVGGAVGTQYIPDTSSYSYGDPTRIFDNANTIDNNQEDFGNLNYYSDIPGSNDQYRVQPKKYVYYDGSHKPSDFETVAAAADVALNSIGDTIGDVGLSFLGTVVGLFSNKYDEDSYRVPSSSSGRPDFDVMTNYVQIPKEETRQKGDFLRSLSVTPSPIIATAGPYYTTGTTATPVTPTPAYYAYQNYPSSTPATFYHTAITTTPVIFFC